MAGTRRTSTNPDISGVPLGPFTLLPFLEKFNVIFTETYEFIDITKNGNQELPMRLLQFIKKGGHNQRLFNFYEP